MASTVLPNGIIIPEKYSRDWYNDLYHNWQELDNLLGGGTPKDGTLTIQKNGTTVGTFSANQATNETINITVPDVNNGTLTIQQNGTTVDTFTANSSTDKTVNITVPTKTSDLTNDSNFVPSTDLATVATSGSYNDLSNKPTIPTVNNATLTIQKNGTDVQTFTANQSTNATANITVPTKTSDLTNDSGFITSDNTKIPLAGSNAISGSLIPSTDGTVNLGGSSYQWNNLYAKNYYYNGTAWGLDKANEWSNNNKFTGNVSITKNSDSPTASSDTSLALTGTSQYIFFRTKGSSNYKSYNSFLWGGYLSGASPYRFGRIRLYRARAVYGETGEETPDTSFSFIDVALHYKWVSLTDNVKFINDETTNACAPLTNNVTDLGTSTNKWKSINGINPGALSLPSDTYIDIDTTNYAWGSNFTFTPDYDGYCFINIGSSSNSRIISLKTGRGEYYFSNQTDVFCFTFPVYKGKLVTILTNSSGTESVIPTIRVFSCQGNV